MKSLPQFIFFSGIALLLSGAVRAQTTIPSGAIFWLKADTGALNNSGTAPANNDVVTEWKDQSGSDKSAYQTVPVSEPIYQTGQINHLPVIHFDGKFNFLNCAPIFPVGKDYTLTLVTRISDFSRANHLLSGNSRALFMAQSQYPTVRNDTSGGQLASNIPLQPQEPAIITVSFRQANGVAAFYIDGGLTDSASIGANKDNHIYFGAYQGLPAFMGDIAEVIIYPAILSYLDRRHLESYLMKKYAILPLPAPDSIYTAVPKHLQFYARGADDSATVNISGNYPEPDYDSIYLKVIKNGDTISRTSQKLVYHDGKAAFSFAPRIHADTFEYSFYLAVKTDSEDRRIAFRDNVVCGDVILIDGQSNSINNNLGYTNEFYRTFGKNQSSNAGDTGWAISDIITGFGGGAEAGAWGVRLQELLKNTYGIPSCVINGGVGGTTIEQHQRDPLNHTNLLTIYGSMLYRAQKANLADKATVLLWYQGESNVYTNYQTNFDSLYHAWKEDYPNVSKIYVMQVRPGCSAGFSADVRDLLRRLQGLYPNIEAVSTMGLPGHDGCHFAPIGYLQLGDQLFRLLARDFYGSTDNKEMSSPDITQAYYTNSAHTGIGLIFSPSDTRIVIPNDTMIGGLTESIKNYFYLDDAFGDVASLSIWRNRLILTLKNPSQAKSVSYLPDKNYNDTAIVYEGPWLVNERNVGALSFFHVPIVDSSLVVVSTKDVPQNLSFSVFPNPSGGKINIHYSLPQTTNVTISITDLLGRNIIKFAKGELSEGEYETIFDAQQLGLANGIYLCTLQAGSNTAQVVVSIVK